MTFNSDNIDDAGKLPQLPGDNNEANPVPGDDTPAPETAKQPRNQHLKVAEPKNKQFAARATESQYNIITAAMRANHCRDIVDLMLFSINLHKNDIFSSFKFK